MRRRLTARIAVAVLLLLPALAACEPERGTPPKKAPTAAAVPPAQPNPEANQPGPQNDPGACVGRGKRALQVIAQWSSETEPPPAVFWSKNGVETGPDSNVKSHKANAPARTWGGEWSRLINVDCGDVVGVRIKGTPSTFAVICTIIDLGDGPVKTGERNCSATYTAP